MYMYVFVCMCECVCIYVCINVCISVCMLYGSYINVQARTRAAVNDTHNPTLDEGTIYEMYTAFH